ncbi:hypothetical protein HYS48_01735 [Candidatus Woesearchaeota archaeon]|nr:hypothetical protein [Candidatus Woesearchaeota archaeon]
MAKKLKSMDLRVLGKRGISNNTLAMLIVLAIVISLGGTWYSLIILKLGMPSLITITGTQTATTTVTVTNVTAIVISQSPVAFGDIARGDKNDTTDNAPAPFGINNTGNVPLNITTNASALFSAVSLNASAYRYNCTEGEGPNCPTGSTVTVTNMATANDTGLNRTAIFDLPPSDGNDSRDIDIFISVPTDESGGSKTSTVTFTAAQI